jgi:hypothetical protein
MDNFPRHVLIVAALLALVLGAGLATQAAGGTAHAPAVTHLVLNEVDYDNVGADNREFVEVFNGTGAPVDLGDKAVVLVNGLTGTEYTRVALGPNCLAPNQYLVVMDPLVVPAPGAISIPFPGADNQIQNGAPDGVALIDTASLTLVDALSYEGSITSAQIDGFLQPVSLVEGAPTPVEDSNVNEGSLDREPNGSTPTTPSPTGRSTRRRPPVRRCGRGR